jgi:uncharacterized protein YecT (DUF1311 family)
VRFLGLLLAIWLVFAATPQAAAAQPQQGAVVERNLSEHVDTYELSFVWPQVGIATIDAALSEWVQGELNSFKRLAARHTPQERPYSAQLRYTLARNDEAAVSVLFKYSIYTGGAHPNLTQSSFNFLMPDAAQVYLPDLLGDDGIQRVSDFAIADLTARLTGPNGMSDVNWIRAGAGPSADNFATFELLTDEIVLDFDPYQVAAYAAGPQQVHIPLAVLQDVLRADPLAPLPSFDCTDAGTAVERAICSDRILAQLDRRTAEAFDSRLQLESHGNTPPTVRTEQIAWLGQRDAACATSATEAALVACLKDQYAQRIVALRRYP